MRLAQLQQVTGLGDVLGGGTPVDVAPRILTAEPREFPYQRNQGVGGAPEPFLEPGVVEELKVAPRHDYLRGPGRDHAEIGLGEGECRLDIEPGLPAGLGRKQCGDPGIRNPVCGGVVMRHGGGSVCCSAGGKFDGTSCARQGRDQAGSGLPAAGFPLRITGPARTADVDGRHRSPAWPFPWWRSHGDPGDIVTGAISAWNPADYATANGTATAGKDYTAASGTLTFAPGETSKTVQVPILDDALDEGSETVTLTLSNASGARIGDAVATGTITNADPL